MTVAKMDLCNSQVFREDEKDGTENDVIMGDETKSVVDKFAVHSEDPRHLVMCYPSQIGLRGV